MCVCLCLCLFKCICVVEIHNVVSLLLVYFHLLLSCSPYTLYRFCLKFTRHTFIGQCVIRLTVSTLLSDDECVCVCNYVPMKLISNTINV